MPKSGGSCLQLNRRDQSAHRATGRQQQRAISSAQGVPMAGRIAAGSGANSMLPDSPVRNDKSSGPPPVGSPPGAAEGRNVETLDGPSGAEWPLAAPQSAARPPGGWPFMISSRAASTLAASAAE